MLATTSSPSLALRSGREVCSLVLAPPSGLLRASHESQASPFRLDLYLGGETWGITRVLKSISSQLLSVVLHQPLSKFPGKEPFRPTKFPTISSEWPSESSGSVTCPPSPPSPVFFLPVYVPLYLLGFLHPVQFFLLISRPQDSTWVKVNPCALGPSGFTLGPCSPLHPIYH